MHEQKEAINEKNDIPTPANVMQMLRNKVRSSLDYGGKRNNYLKRTSLSLFFSHREIHKKKMFGKQKQQ